MMVFISGPVSGMPDNNVAAFATAAYMVQLDGWQHSNGARLEAEIADALGIKRASLREFLENPRLPREDA